MTDVLWRWRLSVTPYPMPRPRRGRNGGVYTPKEAHAAKAVLADELRRRWVRGPLEGPVGLVIVFARLEGRNRSRDGDGDNYEKTVLDAGTGVLWRNDRQVRRCAWSLVDAPEAWVEIELVDLSDTAWGRPA